MLVRIGNVLNAEQVAHVRGVLEKSDWADGKVTAGPLAQKAKNNLQVPETSPAARALGEIILAALGKSDLFNSAALSAHISPPQFNRYDVGMTYGNHIDNALRLSGKRMRTDLSATLFITDPKEYDGGELVVLDTYGFHAVKLAPGDMILYSASSKHRVQPVTRGSRWASFFWIQSMIRDESARNMLFEMDGAIQSLAKKNADAEEILTLTGVYHNLFRRWSEP
ncbi:MAG TPA: Fe2+-dependent dioxygenase [Rhizomicrobium sp.]